MNTLILRLGLLGLLALLQCTGTARAATGQNFIYGEVITQAGDSRTGLLRWGDEEVYWTDHFNGNKAANPNVEHLSAADRKYLKSGRPLVVERWTDAFEIFGRLTFSDQERRLHSFYAQFGDLDRIVRGDGEEVTVQFRNGDHLDLDGGSNDIGAKIRVLSRDGETTQFRWRDIREVRFLDTPPGLEHSFGGSSYGAVITDAGEFRGTIQWDHDERLSTGVLDGEEDGEDVELAFEDIAVIRRGNNASEVTTTDGRTRTLSGTNDVNDENRGIIVDVMGLGRVDIPWEHFESVRFESAPDDLPTRVDFPRSLPLAGTVTTTGGEAVSGRLAFDLDESLDLEFLDGASDGIDYGIPFRYIRRLEPESVTRLKVTLKNGRELTLEGSDAGVENDGILVYTGTDQTRYVRWEDVRSIEFGN